MDFSKGLSFKLGETDFLFRIDGLCEFNTEGSSMHEYCLNETVKVKNWCFDYNWSTSSFCYDEIIYLRESLDKLLSDNIKKETWINFLEPNYCFNLFPKTEHTNESITFEIAIRDKSWAYTDETYEIYFSGSKIEKWIDYLDYIIMKYKKQ